MQTLQEQLHAIGQKAQGDISQAADLPALDDLRLTYLAKRSELSAMMKQMGQLSPEERPVVGQVANEVRTSIETALKIRRESLQSAALDKQLVAETIDVTLPGSAHSIGTMHPLSQVTADIVDIFHGMGFSVVEGPEVELSANIFDKLNTPQNHPSRNWQDTFYFDENSSRALRTHTSCVQVRTMETQKPPIRVIVPGRVYRKDEVDATHSPMFHQLEGLVVDRGITMAHLKGTLSALVEGLYGKGTPSRFRPHHFPFTEPSCEVDCQCFKCRGKGCAMCKGEGWIEILGAGMVHPNVLRNCGIDPDEYSGFAFGMGLDRMTMMRYQITDLRLLFENDVRFLSQF